MAMLDPDFKDFLIFSKIGPKAMNICHSLATEAVDTLWVSLNNDVYTQQE